MTTTDVRCDNPPGGASGEFVVTDGPRLAWVARSIRGRRAHNEDRWAAAAAMFVVADGMGGHDAGDVASTIVVKSLIDDLPPSITVGDIVARISAAHERVAAAGHATGRVMGSTLAGAAVVEQSGHWVWLVFNVGDSRVYLSGQNASGRSPGRQVSVDHSVVQELLERGVIGAADVSRHPERHVITRAIGTPSAHEADYWTWALAAGDRLLICSDGLLTAGGEEAVTRILRSPQPSTDLDALIVSLGERATDDLTVIVVDVMSGELDPDEQPTRPVLGATR